MIVGVVHDLLGNMSVVIKVDFAHVLMRHLRKGGHDDHGVIAVKDVVVSKCSQKMSFSSFNRK